ncbi:glycosyltransferase family 4 protein [Myxococcota bacterium]
MRIAVITSSYPSSLDDPSGHFVRSETTEMARSGARVTVLAPGRGPASDHGANPRVIWIRDAQAFGWPGALARIRRHPWRALGAAWYCWAARRAVLKYGPFDRLIAHWIVPNGWPLVFGLPGQIEVVAHGSDVRLLARLPSVIRRAIVGGMLDRGVTFRFVSRQLRTILADVTFPELVELGRVTPCLIDVPPIGRETARRSIGLRPDELWIIVVGRLVPSKRVDVALRAARLVPRAKVALVGDGPERPRLQRDFGGVRFLGHLSRPDTLTWLAAADLLISSSREEGAPTAVREARALGTPVVACSSGDLPDWSPDDPDLHLVGSQSPIGRGGP